MTNETITTKIIKWNFPLTKKSLTSALSLPVPPLTSETLKNADCLVFLKLISYRKSFFPAFANTFEELHKTHKFWWIQNIVISILSPSFFCSCSTHSFASCLCVSLSLSVVQGKKSLQHLHKITDNYSRAFLCLRAYLLCVLKTFTHGQTHTTHNLPTTHRNKELQYTHTPTLSYMYKHTKARSLWCVFIWPWL